MACKYLYDGAKQEGEGMCTCNLRVTASYYAERQWLLSIDVGAGKRGEEAGFEIPSLGKARAACCRDCSRLSASKALTCMGRVVELVTGLVMKGVQSPGPLIRRRV